MYQITDFFNKVIPDLYQYASNDSAAPASHYNVKAILLVLAVFAILLILVHKTVDDGEDRILLKGFISIMGGLALLVVSGCITPLQDKTPNHSKIVNSLQVGNFYQNHTLTNIEQAKLVSTISNKDNLITYNTDGYTFFYLPYNSTNLTFVSTISDFAQVSDYLTSIDSNNVESIQMSTITVKTAEEYPEQICDIIDSFHICKAFQVNYADGTALRYTNPLDNQSPTIVTYNRPVEFNDNFVDRDITTTLTQTEFSLLLNQGHLKYIDSTGAVQELELNLNEYEFIQNPNSTQSFIRYFTNKFKKPQFYYNITDVKASVDVNANIGISNDTDTGKPNVDVDLNVDVH